MLPPSRVQTFTLTCPGYLGRRGMNGGHFPTQTTVLIFSTHVHCQCRACLEPIVAHLQRNGADSPSEIIGTLR
jgi:hypothetical protein